MHSEVLGFGTRLLSRLAAAVTGARLTTLIFHRVLSTPDPFRPDIPDAALFESLMRLVCSQFQIVQLSEAVRRLADGSLSSRSVAITFDDGYRDNFTVAVPVLQGLGLHATFFVAAGYLDGGRMWNDTVIEAVRACSSDRLDLTALDLGVHDLTTIDDRIRAASVLTEQLKYRPQAERQAGAEWIADVVGAQLPTDLMMTTSQVRALRDTGMAIGAHTLSHPILARVDKKQAQSEINGSKEVLESILKDKVDLFAYPNGKPIKDYDRTHVDLVRAAGFKAAVSTEAGVATHGSDLLQLPRFTPWHMTPLKFSAQLVQNLFRIRYMTV